MFVTRADLTREEAERITGWWGSVSRLPIVVFPSTELLVTEDGAIAVKEVTFAE